MCGMLQDKLLSHYSNSMHSYINDLHRIIELSDLVLYLSLLSARKNGMEKLCLNFKFALHIHQLKRNVINIFVKCHSLLGVFIYETPPNELHEY